MTVQTSAETGGEWRGRSGGPPHVLLAEDNPDMRSLIARTLTLAGCRVTECTDGVDLVDRLVTCLRPNTPMDIDVVVSDVHMPWINGLQVLAAMEEYIGYPPVILITGFPTPEVHARAEELKAAAVFEKPFDLEALVDRIRSLIKEAASGRQD